MSEWCATVNKRERPRAQRIPAGCCGFDRGRRHCAVSRTIALLGSPELVASVSRTVGAVEMRAGDSPNWQNIASASGACMKASRFTPGRDGRLTLDAA